MQVYVERGANRGDCVHKIVKKHGIYFNILREKTIPSKWGGIIPEKVELEYFLSPPRGLGGSLQGSPLQGSPLQGGSLPHSTDYTEPAPVSSGRKPASLLHNDIDFVEAKKQLLKAAGKDPEQVMQQVLTEEAKQQLILDKLSEIEEKIKASQDHKQEHPNLIRIAELLRQNDFSERYIAAILDRAHKELSLYTLENFDAMQDQVLIWIAESIKLYPIPEKPGRIMILVGPTGVGKTTTVAKLAAIYSMSAEYPSFSIRMITIDAFKVGAKKQIKDLAEIMEIPVSYVDNHRDLRREIDLCREETDLILIDTIGRSPRDLVSLGEMKEMLDACGSRAEIHLVLSASTQVSSIEYALQQFEPFNYQAVLLTKLDESRHVGNIISALAEKGKSISYITDGQAVHKNIAKASVARFLINMDDFRVDVDKLEQLFPAARAEFFQ